MGTTRGRRRAVLVVTWPAVRLFLSVAAAYYLTAVLGLTLATPPGYATLVWLPAGIALGCAYVFGPAVLPGVLLGSYMANVWVPTVPERELVLLGGLAPAVGASVQAYVGAAMMRRWMVGRWRLAKFALVAVSSSAINGVWAPTTLFMLGLMPAAVLQRNVLTWWVGDALGALAIAPLVIFLAKGPNERER